MSMPIHCSCAAPLAVHDKSYRTYVIQYMVTETKPALSFIVCTKGIYFRIRQSHVLNFLPTAKLVITDTIYSPKTSNFSKC